MKHTEVEEKKLTWNLQVNASAVTVNLIWIKAEEPIATVWTVASQVPTKRHLSPSTPKKTAQRLNHRKAKRNQVVVDINVHADALTDKPCTQIDDTTQTVQHNSPDLDNNTPVPTSTITHHLVKYYKRGSGPHRADVILKVHR
jgi:hypothetical protein